MLAGILEDFTTDDDGSGFIDNNEKSSTDEKNKIQNPQVTPHRVDFETLEFGEFPVIEKVIVIDSENFSKEFKSAKKSYVESAFDAVRPYYDYTAHLLNHDRMFTRVIEYMVKSIIEKYWDVPASENHHDKTDFGLLKHSIRAAVVAAKNASESDYSSKAAEIDATATRNRRNYIVLSRFIVNLLHDADKLFQIDLKYRDYTITADFEPFKKSGSGCILDFKLVYPANKLVLKWRPNLYDGVILSQKLLYQLFLNNKEFDELRDSCPDETIIYMVSTLANYQSSADHAAVNIALDADNYLNEIRTATARIIRHRDSCRTHEGFVFKVGPDWYLLIHKIFFSALYRELKAGKDSLVKVLAQNKLLFVRQVNDGKHKVTFNLTLFLSGKTGKQYEVSFCRASFFETSEELNEKRVAAFNHIISRQHIDLLENNGLVLPETAFSKKPEEFKS